MAAAPCARGSSACSGLVGRGTLRLVVVGVLLEDLAEPRRHLGLARERAPREYVLVAGGVYRRRRRLWPRRRELFVGGAMVLVRVRGGTPRAVPVLQQPEQLVPAS